MPVAPTACVQWLALRRSIAASSGPIAESSQAEGGDLQEAVTRNLQVVALRTAVEGSLAAEDNHFVEDSRAEACGPVVGSHVEEHRMDLMRCHDPWSSLPCLCPLACHRRPAR